MKTRNSIPFIKYGLNRRINRLNARVDQLRKFGWVRTEKFLWMVKKLGLMEDQLLELERAN